MSLRLIDVAACARRLASLLCVLVAACVCAARAQSEPAAGSFPPRASELLAARIATCAELEGSAPTDDERALLEQFAPELASELLPALALTACDPVTRDDAACESAIATLDCQALAAPVRAAGYDALAPLEITPAMSAYAGALASRVIVCAWPRASDEERSVAVDVTRTKLEIAVALALASPDCRFDAAAIDACVATLRSQSCSVLLGAPDEDLSASMLTGVCPDVLSCVPRAPE